MLLFLLGQGIQEDVDGMVERSLHVVAQKQPAGMVGDVFLRRDEVNGVFLHGHAVLGLQNRHLCILAEYIGHQALIVGGQMLDDHEAQSAVCRHEAKELLQGLQPARRSADAHHKHVLAPRFRSARSARFCLRLRFHALGDQAHAPALANFGDIARHHLRNAVGGDAAHHAAIQLHRAEVQVGQHGEVGIAGTKIIQRKGQPVAAEALDEFGERVVLKAAGGFGDLQFQKRLRHVRVAAQNGQHRSQRRGVEQRLAGKIAGNGAQRVAPRLPAAERIQNAAKDEVVQFGDVAVRLHALDDAAVRQKRALRVPHAGQRFRADKLAGAHIHLRLQIDGEAPFLRRSAASRL